MSDYEYDTVGYPAFVDDSNPPCNDIRLNRMDQGLYQAHEELKARVMKNYFINGNFDVWQRGISFNSNWGQYCADRWASGAGSGYIVTRDTNVPDAKSKYAYKIVAAGVAAGSSGGYIQHRIEGVDAGKLGGQLVNINFKHQATTTAGTLSMSISLAIPSAIDNFATVDSWVVASGVTVSSSYSLQKIAFTLPLTSPVSGYSIGNGLQVIVSVIQVGASGTVSSWYSQMQLNLGDVASPFQPRTYAEELLACLRYCWVITSAAQYDAAFGGGVIDGATRARFMPRFPVPMRATPTTSISAAADITVINGAATFVPTSLTTGSPTQFNADLLFNYTTGGLTAGQAVNTYWSAAGKWIRFDAEL